MADDAPAPVLILQHVAVEGPGGLGELLRRRGHQTLTLRPDRGEPVPTTLEGARSLLGAQELGGLVVMGGPMGVPERHLHPHLEEELRLIDAALEASLPILGICLGSQLLAHALGATVQPGHRKEIGWHPVTLSDEAQRDPLWTGISSPFVPLHWHGDVFTLPAGATRLASSALTREQAFRHGRAAYGLLFHLEADREQVAAMVAEFSEELAGAGVDGETLLSTADRHLPQARHVGDIVFARWADAIQSGGR